MDGWIDISEAARVLGYGEEPSDSVKGSVRIILKHFNVESQDEPKPEGQFGKARKLYKASQVQQVASFGL